MFFIFSCHVTSCDKHNEYVHEIELLGRSRSATTCMSQKPSSHSLCKKQHGMSLHFAVSKMLPDVSDNAQLGTSMGVSLKDTLCYDKLLIVRFRETEGYSIQALLSNALPSQGSCPAKPLDMMSAGRATWHGWPGNLREAPKVWGMSQNRRPSKIDLEMVNYTKLQGTKYPMLEMTLSC